MIHSKGVVKLGDFGVSACMFDSGERMRTRNTFVGTPCWYAVNSLYVLVFGWFVLAKRDFFLASSGWHLRLCSK